MRLFIVSIITLLLYSCGPKDPNVNQEGENVLESLKVEKPLTTAQRKYVDTLYVPIYSDIYFNANNSENQLAATLSIRNTSLSESIYVTTIDYYNSEGELVREYIDGPIELNPMATVDYVIDRDDASGGSGANFIVILSSNDDAVKPIVQAVMVGSAGNEGVAFSVDGISIKK